MTSGRCTCALALLALLAGCKPAAVSPVRPPEPRAVDTAGMSAAELRTAVLQECHGPLQGEMDRIAVDVTLPDGSTLVTFAELPERLRVQGQGRQQVINGDDAFQLEAGPVAVTASESERQRLHALRSLLDLAALGPLYRAGGCERDGALLRLEADGARYELTLRAGTLLPERLQGPGGTLQFQGFKRTSGGWIAERVAFEPLGACKLYFVQSGLGWQPGLFTRPGADAPQAPAPKFLPGFSPEDRPEKPKPAENRAMTWVVLDDPGDWPSRSELYRRHLTVLEAQGQQIAGRPTFLVENGRRVMAVGFRQRDRGPAFTAPPEWELRERPAAGVLVVFPPPGGTLAERIARGEQQLRDALQASGRTAQGPIMAQPYLNLEEGTPDPKRIDTAVLRMSVVPR